MNPILFESAPPSPSAPWLDRIETHLGLVFRAGLPGDCAAAWLQGVYAGRTAWTSDWDGEQFSLGYAFYTHLEQGRSRAYFDGAAASDALVEQHLPGMQAHMRALAAAAVGTEVCARPSWCGAGVHVFPAGEAVARRGGVIHADTEGLSRHHLGARARALTLVAMLQPPRSGGGLRLWRQRHLGRDALNEKDAAGESEMVSCDAGDVLVFDSYRLHQIQPFGGAKDRVSITLHAAETEPGFWESWF